MNSEMTLIYDESKWGLLYICEKIVNLIEKALDLRHNSQENEV